MLKDLIFYTFVIISVINTLHFGFYIVGANVYDIMQIYGKKPLRGGKVRRQAQAKKREKRPLVTVIIPAHNEEKSIARCLDSVRRSTYRKLQIIVVDDKSTDSTRSIVWHYIKAHPNWSISLMRKNTNVGKGEAMNHVLKHGAKGDLIMTLDADSQIGKKAIKNAVDHFDDPLVVGMAANVQIMNSKSILGLLQKFEHMIGYRSKKFYTLTNSEFIVGGVASTYRREVIKGVKFYDTDTLTEDIGLSFKLVSHGNKDQRIVYAADVLAMTEGVQTYRALFKQRYRWKMGMLQNLFKYKHMVGSNSSRHTRMLTLYRLPMAVLGEAILLIEPLLIMYIVYISIVNQYPFALIGAYVTITLYVLWNLWPDEHTSNRQKLRLTVYAPVMYFVFYVMNLVQIVSMLRCLGNRKQITRKVRTSGVWVSPERAGVQA